MPAMDTIMSTLAAVEPSEFTKLMMRQPGATVAARQTDDLYVWLFWFCVVWFVMLMTMMVYFIFRYGRKKGRIAPNSSAHNTPLEVTWTLIPTALVIYIFWMGFDGYMKKIVAPGDAVEMRLTGFKWSWKIEYPNGAETNVLTTRGAREIPVFYMPAERAVRFRMNSTDVMHSFWVPDFRVKADLLPNRYTTFWFRANAPSGDNRHATNEAQSVADKEKGIDTPFIVGLENVPYEDHWVFCAEYCGTEHSEMAAIIRIVPEADYNRWLESISGGNMTPVQIGETQWKLKCAACHTVDGRTNTGPTWKNLFGHEVEFTDGTKYSAQQMSDPAFFANYVTESIRVPGAKVVKGFANNMTPWSASQVSDKQIDGLIAYMMSLSDNAAPAK